MDTFAYESLTIGTVTTTMTSSIYAPTGQSPAIYAYLTTETDTVRYRTDGTAPTSSEGHNVAAAGSCEVNSESDIRHFNVIRSGTSNATIRITYKR